jgi:hypothetical protein
VEAAETCQRVFQSIGANTSPDLVAKVSVAAYQLSVLVGRGGDWRRAISFGAVAFAEQDRRRLEP